MTGNYGCGGDIILQSRALEWLHAVYMCFCPCACWHVCFWLISSAVWIQQRLSLCLLHNGRQGMSQQRILPFLQTCCNAHAFPQAHVCTCGPSGLVLLQKMWVLCLIRWKQMRLFPLWSWHRAGPTEREQRQRSRTFHDRVNYQFTTVCNWRQGEAYN